MAVNDHGFTVVAIPSDIDEVWKISSEKVPHMTLLFLGDQLDNLARVKSFIKHAVDVSLSKFTLGVERRGVLGKQSADVLFFPKTAASEMADFRAQLLTNIDIFKAYNSVEQFPEWTPHLTLGFPETPAKKVDLEWGNIHTVSFDRIALWTGDSEGVEFPLKTDDKELSMAEKGAAFFQHFGVKGMKWGVRKNVEKGAAFLKEAHLPSQDAKTAARSQTKAKLGGVRTLSDMELRRVINRMALEKQYRDLYGEHQLHDEAVSRAKRWTKRGARWAGKFAEDVGKDAAATWISRPRSGSSTKRDPVRVQAWTTGQQFANALDGGPRAIGS